MPLEEKAKDLLLALRVVAHIAELLTVPHAMARVLAGDARPKGWTNGASRGNQSL